VHHLTVFRAKGPFPSFTHETQEKREKEKDISSKTQETKRRNREINSTGNNKIFQHVFSGDRPTHKCNILNSLLNRTENINQFVSRIFFSN
jgi:hypothetical protein